MATQFEHIEPAQVPLILSSFVMIGEGRLPTTSDAHDPLATQTAA
jgi:hypothetical protein